MTKWGDEAVEKVAATIYEKYKPRHHAAWDVFCKIDGNREFMLKVARAAIIATLDFLATPSEAMRGAAKFSESQIPLGNGTSVTVAGGLGDLPFDYWRMLSSAKREIEGT